MCMMGRRSRRIVGTFLVIGIVICCCSTFISKHFSAEQPLQNVFARIQKEIFKENKESSLSISKHTSTFARAAEEMKVLANNYSSDPRHNLQISEDNSDPNGDKINDEGFPILCNSTEKMHAPNSVSLKASIIITLYHLGSSNTITLLYRLLHTIPDHVTNDVIITAEDHLSEDDKQRIETAVDLCDNCRLFFLKGSIYEHRNQATKFTLEEKIIFVDARIIPADGWIEPLLFELHLNPHSVVSPNLHLCDYEDSYCDVGFSRLEMTWDLNVIRAPLASVQQRLVHSGQIASVNQTAVLREVMAIRKDFFIHLGKFDIIPAATGGEHVSFSLKVITCGGNILMSTCSRVFLEVSPALRNRHDIELSTDNVIHGPEETYFMRDYPSPSFREKRHNVTVYFDINSRIWLDSYSQRLYSSSAHRKITYGDEKGAKRTPRHSRQNHYFTLYGKYASILKNSLLSMKCSINKFRFIITKFQDNTFSPNSKTTHFGYVRSLDGLFAVGLEPESPFFANYITSSGKRSNQTAAKSQHSITKIDVNNKTEDIWLTYTRNSTLWIGPLSFETGQLHYKDIWCLTAILQRRLALKLCQNRSRPLQTFHFVNGVFRWTENDNREQLCVKVMEEPSHPDHIEAISKTLVLLPCEVQQPKTKNARFIMDMEFRQ